LGGLQKDGSESKASKHEAALGLMPYFYESLHDNRSMEMFMKAVHEGQPEIIRGSVDVPLLAVIVRLV
jgi:hypothetical protein